MRQSLRNRRPPITVVDEAQPTNHARGSSTAPGLLDPGTTFNDAMRSPVNELGQNGVEAGQPAFGSAAPQTNDLVALKNGLLAELNSGQYSGATLGHVQAILSDINTAISSANAAANGASVPGMEQALRASQLSIINAVNTDPVLANPAPQNGPTEPTEPEAKPAEDAETPAENTEPAETAETGDATDATQVTDDLDAAIAEMEALIAANPEVFSGLTVDDAEEIVHQIQLELAQINEGDASPGTAQERQHRYHRYRDGRYRSGKPGCATAVESAGTAGRQHRRPHPCHRLPPYRSTMSRPRSERVRRPRSSSITAIRARPNR